MSERFHSIIVVAAMRHLGTLLSVLAIVASIPSLASAQEPRWAFGVRGGVVMGSDDATEIGGSSASIERPAPLLSVDVIHRLDCCLEVYGSGLFPRLTVAGAASPGSHGVFSPNAIQIGMNYRLHRSAEVNTRQRAWWYVGPFIGGFARDRSTRFALPVGTGSASTPVPSDAVYQFPGGWGLGVGGGFRYRTNERFSIDVNVKWQHLPLLIGDADRVSWNPVTVTGGIVARLF